MIFWRVTVVPTPPRRKIRCTSLVLLSGGVLSGSKPVRPTAVGEMALPLPLSGRAEPEVSAVGEEMVGTARVPGVTEVVVFRATDVGAEQEIIELVVEGGKEHVQGQRGATTVVGGVEERADADVGGRQRVVVLKRWFRRRRHLEERGETVDDLVAGAAVVGGAPGAPPSGTRPSNPSVPPALAPNVGVKVPSSGDSRSTLVELVRPPT